MATRLKKIGVFVAAAVAANAQAPETLPSGARGLQSQVFLELRQSSESPKPEAPKAKAGEKIAKGEVQKNLLNDAFLGLTLWKMVVAPPSAPVRSRGFIHPVEDPGGKKDWTPERMTLDRPVHENDYVRFTFESAPKGFLYVINRDVFANGSLGEPILIFPTQRIHGGNNRVEPGHPVQIPDPQDHPDALQVDPPKPNQTGILLIVISTPQRIPEVQIAADQQKIPEAWLKRWESQWATNVEVSSDAALDGRLVTIREQAAAADPSKALGASDSAPVSLFHRRGSAGQPIYVSALIKLVSK
jgi:hypothetical protein